MSHRFSTNHDRSPVASRTSWEESVPVRTGHGSFTPAASPPSPHHRQAPPTPRRYPNPVMDYLVSLCQGPGLCDGFPLQQMQDPMLLEVKRWLVLVWLRGAPSTTSFFTCGSSMQRAAQPNSRTFGQSFLQQGMGFGIAVDLPTGLVLLCFRPLPAFPIPNSPVF